MSHPTDLLPYGELLADAGLVARLLDDGGLSLTEDDSLPDEARVVFSGTPQGLRATLQLLPCDEATPELRAAIGELNAGQVHFVWEGGAVRCHETLPWTADFAFPLETLRGLYDRVSAGANQRDALKQFVPEAIGSPVLPPSFLPGSGQSSRSDGVTQRYGAIDATPGRAEVEAREIRWNTNRYQQQKGGGGTQVVVIAAVATVGLLGLAGVGVVIMNSSDNSGWGEVASATPGATPGAGPRATSTAATGQGEGDPGPDGPEQPSGSGGTERTPDVRPSNDRPRKPPRGRGDPYQLASSVNPSDRSLGLGRWRDDKLYLHEGARLKMLKAFDGRQDREQTLMLIKTIRDSPPGVLEMIDCLDRVASGSAIWRELVEQLGKAQLAPEELDVVAEVLGEAPDTKDLVIEETLVRIGRPKKGAGPRLLEARGVDWLIADGEALFANLPLEDQASLIGHDDDQARRIGLNLVAETGKKKDPRDAVKILATYLDSKHTDVKQRSIELIGGLGEGVGAWYLALAMMTEKDRRTLELLRSSLNRLPAKAAIGYLSKLAKHKGADRRVAALSALRAITHPDSIEVMIQAVKDPEQSVRVEALSALANLARDNENKVMVAKGVLDYRRIAKDKSDPEARRYARQLCLSIDGRLPR